ncbi:hypothetical protein [Brevibacillus borstelensis]|uniref:hypothetical protein n=1 Tax=Brevibacillus borstelensis TaxID=45462 RepID=UPI0030BCAFAA
MKAFILDTLEAKGVTVPREHLTELDARWQALLGLKKKTADALLDDNDIALRHIPGGDHFE